MAATPDGAYDRQRQQRRKNLVLVARVRHCGKPIKCGMARMRQRQSSGRERRGDGSGGFAEQSVFHAAGSGRWRLEARRPWARIVFQGIAAHGSFGYTFQQAPRCATLSAIMLPWFQDRFPLYLAPMAGVTDTVFRQLAKEYGADVMVTEFVSAEGIFRRNDANARVSRIRRGRTTDRRAALRRGPSASRRSRAHGHRLEAA